jgi:hypothetical protein
MLKPCGTLWCSEPRKGILAGRINPCPDVQPQKFAAKTWRTESQRMRVRKRATHCMGTLDSRCKFRGLYSEVDFQNDFVSFHQE